MHNRLACAAIQKECNRAAMPRLVEPAKAEASAR